MTHPHHSDLVETGCRAYFSCGSLSSAITTTCEDNDWPAPTENELCDILCSIHQQVR